MSNVLMNHLLLLPASRRNLLLNGMLPPVSSADDRKPLPLTTVELQQSGSRLLHMTPKRILDVSCLVYHTGRELICRSPRNFIKKVFSAIPVPRPINTTKHSISIHYFKSRHTVLIGGTLLKSKLL